MATSKKRILTLESDDELESRHFTFKGNDNFARFLVIESKEEKEITSLSPFIIEKQIESVIGTPKSVKKLKNKTLLIETSRKTQTENLLKITSFFNIKVSVTEHKSLNSSKGIIRDRTLKGESEQDIVDYLKDQGVTACKRFKIKKDHGMIETNTLLLTFNTISVPKSLKIFYRIIPVDVYVPNPLRCFNCQKFGHHESNCPEDPGSVCENCGTGGHDHHTLRCKNPVKCVNCGKDHISKSNLCEIWKKEKEIMKLKVTKNITYPEAKKLYENQQPELNFSRIVHSLSEKPQMKTTATQYNLEDTEIHSNTNIIKPSPKVNKAISQAKPSSQTNQNSQAKPSPQSKSSSQSQSSSRSQSSANSSRNSQTSSQSRSRPQNRSNSPRQRSDSKHKADHKQKSDKQSDKTTSNRQSKGSNDPVKMANRYESLDELEMDTSGV